MVYFTSREIVAISMSAALWGVLNSIISPIFWEVTHLPFVCDLIGFTCLIIAVWWTKKFGAAPFKILAVKNFHALTVEQQGFRRPL